MLPHQTHSDTSRDAAISNSTSGAMREKIYAHVCSKSLHGTTADEVAARFTLVPGTVSARFRGLELDEMIVKTTVKRLTRSGRNANVYVSKLVFDNFGFTADTKKDLSELEQLRADNESLSQAVKALLIFNNMLPKCWDAEDYFSLKDVIHKALDEIREIMSPELLELIKQEKIKG